MGLNGAGKTSLLRILAGETEQDAGELRVRARRDGRLLRAGARGICATASTCSPTCARRSPADDQTLRSLLGMFGLPGEMAFQDAGTLSGGEKTKLALAQLVAGGTNLLLLDEPTNNLDPPSRTAIARGAAATGRARWSS